MALDPIEEARARSEIDVDAVEFLPYPDDDAGLGRGAIAVEFYGRRKQMMARPGMAGVERGAAALDELLERSAEPGHGNVAVGRERGAQIFPLALVAGDAPGLNQFRAGDLVGEYGGSVGQVRSPSLLTNDRTIPTSVSSSAKADDPVFSNACCLTPRSVITGCPAFAVHDRNNNESDRHPRIRAARRSPLSRP